MIQDISQRTPKCMDMSPLLSTQNHHIDINEASHPAQTTNTPTIPIYMAPVDPFCALSFLAGCLICHDCCLKDCQLRLLYLECTSFPKKSWEMFAAIRTHAHQNSRLRRQRISPPHRELCRCHTESTCKKLKPTHSQGRNAISGH